VEVDGVPSTIEIKMTGAGFEVTSGGSTTSFRDLTAAVGFARERLQRAEAIRQLKTRIE
jgi:hypothetical protein